MTIKWNDSQNFNGWIDTETVLDTERKEKKKELWETSFSFAWKK